MKINVKVITNKNEQNVIRLDKYNYTVSLKSTPQKGKANKELIKLLANNFDVPISNIFIKSGETSKNKIIEIKSN